MACDEPINLREWRAPTTTVTLGRLFTCGRPGRCTYGRARRPVDDSTIDLWANGLPEALRLDIVSLLGTKTDGYSEFAYYPFRSSKEANDKPTFQEWLDKRHQGRFVVHEFPTVDAQGVPKDVLQAVTRCALNLLREGRTVVVIDSAGAERTARVSEAMGYKCTT